MFCIRRATATRYDHHVLQQLLAAGSEKLNLGEAGPVADAAIRLQVT
jgi:hypothetical protein